MEIDIQKQKETIRNQMITLRKSIPVNKKKNYDQWVCEHLIEIVKQRKANRIHCYLPIRYEIDIYPFIETMLVQKKTIICPKTLKDGRLSHLILHDIEQIENGILGTKHPKGNKIYTGQYDLIILPGLAFDENKKRLGYGGGYYDRFLSQHPYEYSIAPCYPFQIVKQLPNEPHDIAVNHLVFKTKLTN